jgi:glutathione S-transferase
MKLYDIPLSGNCYKIRLFLSLLGKDYEIMPINATAGENRTAAFLEINPRGQVPVLEDDGLIIWDSTAILMYLARRYGDEAWLPLDATGLAAVSQWLAVAQNEILYGLARARAMVLFKRAGDMQEYLTVGTGILEVMEKHLENREWLALERPTLADIACFPYVALAPDAGITLEHYPAIRAWIRRIKTLPGYTGMQGLN